MENEGRLIPQKKIRMLFPEEEKTQTVRKFINVYHDNKALIPLNQSLLLHTLKMGVVKSTVLEIRKPGFISLHHLAVLQALDPSYLNRG